MEAYITEWLSLFIRWIHVIAAIAWIGHAFLFHSFEHGLRPPEVDGVDKDVKGEMWMVHGGGFFRLQKTRVLPDRYTGELLWFKWEAAFTWMSGFLLLIIVFYLGGGIYLVDPSVSDVSVGASMAIGLGTLVVGWVIYDLLWSSPLGKHVPIATALTLALIAGAAIGLSQVLSGRAAYIHVGALLGTIMVNNVWARILPNSRKMIAALEAGNEPDLTLGEIGKQRSLHNGYMHFPIIFIMISNHFPSTYGHEYNWLILLLLMVVGAAMRQVLYDGLIRSHPLVKIVLAASLGGLIYLTAPFLQSHGDDHAPPVTGAGQDIDPATVGEIRGLVSFSGQAPEPRPLTLLAGCENIENGTVYDDSVLIQDGKLQNAFVWIRDGWQGWNVSPPPATAVEVDQRACIYRPRIVGVRVGQPVTFINSDPLFHNVRSVSDANETFSLNMPGQNQRDTRTFKRPEVMVQTRCDVHPWMRSYIGVVPHPWFAITDASGSFSLIGVPPGEYVIEAWHEVYGTVTQRITVPAGGVADARLAFAPE